MMNTQPKNDVVQARRGNDIKPPRTGVTPIALPEVHTPYEVENSQTGVSTGNAPFANAPMQNPKESFSHWYVIRCTYGRERKAYEFFLKHGIEAFYPTITSTKTIDGKIETVIESRLPNILFAYGSFDTIKEYVYDNYHEDTKHLRFYYQHYHDGLRIMKKPLIVPESQIRSLMIICNSNDGNISFHPFPVEKFIKGQRVQIIDGIFKGVVGIVARFYGQQRVGIVIDNLLTMTTAYVPSAFLSVEE